jgi:hypothetical protein
MKKMCILILFVLVPHFSYAAEKGSNTLSLKEGETGQAASIQDLSWMAGYYKGDGLGGQCEEFWTPPSEDSMVGLFRLVKDGKSVFQEIFIIREENNTLILKLKHFNPDLTGWEEKNQTVDFPLVRLGPNEAYFDGLTYRKAGDGALLVFLRLRQKSGEVVEEEFRFSRQ